MSKKGVLIEENIGLVHACCKRFKNRGIEYEDLFSAGCLGLVKAGKNFDSSRNLQFSTYAVPVILGEIKQLFRDSGTVKVSRSLKELSLKAKKVCDEYMRENGCDIPVSTLAQKLNCSAEKAVDALNCCQFPLSLTSEKDEDSDSFLDIPVDSGEEKLTEKMSLAQAVNQLESKDKSLIILRYYKQKTQSQTAKELGMTQVQVSRREKKILTAIRQKLTV
ncbi:MAG: sigma-70 family RNA polymerase sigma factor [bacterium]|nr:sigma-70 family RNA polymerase sigma factor [bacterium]MDD6226007.1 sigma-70 family RNA polymerase sigma factor [bacterium]MDY3861732.1 sigma-70 family RNA polymerase sigma factor [Ruminococcus sp.]